jgi:hypothetical protein
MKLKRKCKEGWTRREDKKEDGSNYFVLLRKREDTGHCKRKNWISVFGKTLFGRRSSPVVLLTKK